MEKKYFKRLDIIRDLSCILVLLYHLNILKGGFLAVCTFFTLSGYLSCMSALKNDRFSIKSYYISRFKKIYFPLIIVVFITVILSKLNPSINWINLKQETLSAIFGYNNFWQLNANLDYFTRNVNSPFMHLWYISILIQFDLVFPIVFTFFKKAESKRKKKCTTLVVSFLTIATTILFFYMSKTKDIMVVYYNTFARSFSLFFGILLSVIHYRYNFMLSKVFQKSNTLVFVIYNILLIVLCIFMPAESNNYAIYMLLTTIISTRLIEYATYEGKRFGKFDKHIKNLSKISYEVYLVQYPIIFFMQNLTINDSLKVIVIILLTFITSFILHLLINFPLKNKKFMNFKIIILSIIIIWGSFIVITEKDHSAEMKELENRLNENAKIIEEKNNEEVITVNIDQKESNTNSESMEQDENKIAEKENNQKETIVVENLPVVGIGDSVLLTAIEDLYDKFPNGYFDCKISRTIPAAKDIIVNLINKGKIGDIVILSLATNGDYSDKKNKELMDVLEDRQVYWVDAAGADDPKFNEKFREFAKNYSNIHIVEWEEETKKHPEYLEPDKIHPNYKGCKPFVQLIYDTICQNISTVE